MVSVRPSFCPIGHMVKVSHQGKHWCIQHISGPWSVRSDILICSCCLHVSLLLWAYVLHCGQDAVLLWCCYCCRMSWLNWYLLNMHELMQKMKLLRKIKVNLSSLALSNTHKLSYTVDMIDKVQLHYAHLTASLLGHLGSLVPER